MNRELAAQTVKKSKTALKNFMRPGGAKDDIWGQGLRAEKNKYPFFFPKEHMRNLISKEIKSITHFLLFKAHPH